MSEKLKSEVDIRHSGDEKYVILLVTNRKTNEEKYVFVSYPLPYHADIVEKYERKLQKFEDADVQGGGLIQFDPEGKKLKTYGRSGGYGPPDISLVKEILKEHFPNFEREITVTDFIRN
eukprot:TRINITY_DN2866_c0_g1_i1.p1 TRINITY_DN2866_c0_g1~~TRINITY_DN2866_c0_g1_i1.p1  ORF type:complete len:136 (-),score=32.91 TRINITY_DN2866_c0_g1_i1:83-439(-)